MSLQPDDVKEQVQAAAGNLLAFDNVDFGQTIYLSKFYEAIEAIAGVEYVTIREFRREDQDAGSIESSGKIVLSSHEIPRVPDDADDGPNYAGGLKVMLEGES